MADIPTNDDPFIARLRKLLQITPERGASEGEAANAAGMVQRMLAERGITMAQVAGRVAAGEAGQNEKRGKQKHDRSAMYKYQQTLMRALAKNNFCMYFLEEERAQSFGKERLVKRHVLLGRESNVIATTMTYDYLVAAMDRLVEEYGCTGMAKRGRDALLWLDGCAERLVERLNELREKMQRESEQKKQQEEARQRHPAYAGTGNALVTLNDVYGTEEDLNSDALRGVEPGTTARERRESEARHAAWKAERTANEAKWKAAGIDPELWHWLHIGYTLEQAQAREAEWVKQQTQAAKRQSRRSYSSNYRESAADRREREKQYEPAYRAGKSAGDTISLNKQVNEDRRHRLK